MKRLWILVFAVFVFGAQSSDSIDVRIWKRIIFDLSLRDYRVFTKDRRLYGILSRIDGVKMVGRCDEATIIVETKRALVEDPACANVPRLSDNYRLLLKNPNEIGAFFWMKGRPTIIFAKKRLERFGLHVAPELRDYVEEIEP